MNPDIGFLPYPSLPIVPLVYSQYKSRYQDIEESEENSIIEEKEADIIDCSELE